MGKLKGNRKSEKSRDGGSGKTGMGRDILAVGLLALGTVLAIALVTFSALDGQLITHGVPPASNLVGPVGHHVARALYQVLGFSCLLYTSGAADDSLRVDLGSGHNTSCLLYTSPSPRDRG